MKTKSIIIIICIFFQINLISFAQNVGINTTGANPNASAMLDIVSNNKGLLIPRVSLTQTALATPVTTPATSLLVYNTATVNDVTPGYYYWNGAKWVKLLDSNLSTGDNDWEVNGNNVYTGHGGTYPSGNVGIKETSPQLPLHIKADNDGLIRFEEDGAGSEYQEMYITNDGDLEFRNDAGDMTMMLYDSPSKVAIGGTSTLGYSLYVGVAAAASSQFGFIVQHDGGTSNQTWGGRIRNYSINNNSTKVGLEIGVSNAGTGIHQGLNVSTSSNTASVGENYGIKNALVTGGTGNQIGISSTVAGGTATGNRYAFYTNMTTDANGDIYGIYSSVTKNAGTGNGYAGYFQGGNLAMASYFDGNIRLTGEFRDASGDAGTAGQVLTSTGTGTNWAAATAGGSDDDWLPLGAANTDLIYHEGEVNTKELNGVVVVGTNGYTDIQTAINALPATGGKVLITEGTWNVPNDITFPYDNITVKGVGKSTILNCTIDDQIFYISGRNNIEIKNMTIQYSSYVASSSRAAIYLYRSTNCVVSNCTILNAYYGIYLYGTSTQYTEHNIIHNNKIKDGRYGIGTGAGIGSTTYYYVRRNQVHNNFVKNMGAYGIYFFGHSDANTVSNNEVRKCDSQGIVFMYSDSCVISNNRIIDIQTRLGGSTGVGINLQGCSNSIISDNYIADISGTVSNGSGIRVIEQSGVFCYNTTITGNQIHLDGSLTGIRMTSPRRAVVSNNLIYNTQGSSSNAYAAIMVYGTTPQNVIISDNMIYGSTTATSSGENYSGILCTDGPLYCNISDNTVYGYRRGLTVDAGSNNVIQGNNSYNSIDGLYFTSNSSTIIIGNNANGTGLNTTGSVGQIGYNIP